MPQGHAKAARDVLAAVSLAEGRITKETIRAGQADSRRIPAGHRRSLPDLADRLPAGHRAVTIVVQGADTGGKRLAEGDYIDLAMTVEGTHPDLGEVLTRTLMRNVLVVDAAAGQPLRPRRRARPTTQPDSMITVAVLPADANKLIVAQRTGTLHATLVSSEDVGRRPGRIGRRRSPAASCWASKKSSRPRSSRSRSGPARRMQIMEMSDDRVPRIARRRPAAAAVPVASRLPIKRRQPQLSGRAADTASVEASSRDALPASRATRARSRRPLSSRQPRVTSPQATLAITPGSHRHVCCSPSGRRANATAMATATAKPLLQAEGLEAEFQRLKTGIHRELLDSLDLSRITGLSDDELREDIRHLAEGMLRTPLAQAAGRSTRSAWSTS